MTTAVSWVVERLQWLARKQIWPEGRNVRYLWTDAFGGCLLLSLYQATGDSAYLRKAEWLVEDVYKHLGDTRCMRIGLEDRDEKYPFSYAHYNAMWLYFLYTFSLLQPGYKHKAIEMVKATHPCFVVKRRGVWWKIYADGSGPQPGVGFGGLDPYQLYVAYRLLDPERRVIAQEIADVEELVMSGYRHFSCSQDLGLGMILWCTHFFPTERWAQSLQRSCLQQLEEMWVDKGDEGGYFARSPWARHTCIAFANFGVGIGLQSIGKMTDKVSRMHKYLDAHIRDDPEYAEAAITHVMACNSRFPGWLVANNLPTPATATTQPSFAGSHHMAHAKDTAGMAPGVAAGSVPGTRNDEAASSGQLR